jgi:amino acid transporter
LHGIFTEAASVFFVFTLLDAVSTSAEEVKDPQKNLHMKNIITRMD